MIAKAIHKIQPLAPSVESDTFPGAQPEFFARGERIPQPTNIPRFMDRVVGKPMMIPKGERKRSISE